jgi:hypothetical protein
MQNIDSHPRYLQCLELAERRSTLPPAPTNETREMWQQGFLSEDDLVSDEDTLPMDANVLLDLLERG